MQWLCMTHIISFHECQVLLNISRKSTTSPQIIQFMLIPIIFKWCVPYDCTMNNIFQHPPTRRSMFQSLPFQQTTFFRWIWFSGALFANGSAAHFWGCHFSHQFDTMNRPTETFSTSVGFFNGNFCNVELWFFLGGKINRANKKQKLWWHSRYRKFSMCFFEPGILMKFAPEKVDEIGFRTISM